MSYSNNTIIGRVHSTESFGTVDGPGIRFVIFMQGCPMRCLYCHNPDTWEFGAGKEMTVSQILSEYESCRAFMSGGITVTGGEPLMQKEFVSELFKEAKERGIHTCLDTSGAGFSLEKASEFDALIANTDLVMLDIKHIDDVKHRELTGLGNKNTLDFAQYLSQNGVDIWLRHVVVPDITDKEEDWHKIGLFASKISTLKAIDVLPYHDMGKTKYDAMGLDYPLKDTLPLDKSVASRAKSVIIEGIKQGLKNTIDIK